MNNSRVKKINGKFYDFGTTNQSFLQTAKELQVLGIKNYYFMLEIKNPNLVGLDPHLMTSPQEIALALHESRHNMWYFIRECVRLRTDAGIVKYGLHRGLAASLWCFEQRFDSCLCQPRQTYKTSGIVGGPIQWAFQLSENLKMQFFGKDGTNTQDNLASLRDDIDLLPKWLQFTKYIDDNGKVAKSGRNVKELQNKVRKNKVRVNATARNELIAQSMGRGASVAIIYFDEIEFTNHFPVILGNSAPAFKTAAENAKSAGFPYGRIMSSTPQAI